MLRSLGAVYVHARDQKMIGFGFDLKNRHSRSGKDAFKEYLQHFGKWLIFSLNRAYLTSRRTRFIQQNTNGSQLPLIKAYTGNLGFGFHGDTKQKLQGV
jgi:hypothetical protein